MKTEEVINTQTTQTIQDELQQDHQIQVEINETRKGLRCCGEPTEHLYYTSNGVELRQCPRCMRYIRIENRGD